MRSSFFTLDRRCTNGDPETATTNQYLTGVIHTTMSQGCQMVYFQTKNHNWGNIWRALEWKMLLYFMTIWNIFYRLV
jgi:hypothetical protein